MQNFELLFYVYFIKFISLWCVNYPFSFSPFFFFFAMNFRWVKTYNSTRCLHCTTYRNRFADWKYIGMHSGLCERYNAHRNQHIYREFSYSRSVGNHTVFASDCGLGHNWNVVPWWIDVQRYSVLTGKL